jgi:hypothetical protein
VGKLTDEYEDGIQRRDASVHERLFAADYTCTPGNGTSWTGSRTWCSPLLVPRTSKRC